MKNPIKEPDSFDDFIDPTDEEYRLEKVIISQPIFDDVELEDDYFIIVEEFKKEDDG